MSGVRLSFLKSPMFLIAALVILGVSVLEIAHPFAVQRLELMTFDWRAQLAHKYRGPCSCDATNLGLVEISDNTIYEVKIGRFGFGYGLYWPRDVYAAALKELSLEGAKAVAFDVLFAELRDDQGIIAEPDGSFISHDDVFAQQLGQSGNVILAADKGVMPHPKFRGKAWAVANISVDKDADGVLRRDRAYKDFPDWDRVILQAAARWNWDLDKTIFDTRHHRIIFISRRDDARMAFPTDEQGRIAATNILNTVPPDIAPKIVPCRPFRAWSMGILLAAYELELDLKHPAFQPGRIILHGPNGITRSIPVDEEGYFYMDWSLAQNDPQLTQGAFEELLAAPIKREHGESVPNLWKDKLVVVGSTATGNDLADLGTTPLESHTFLVSKHLNVANSVISGRFVRQTPLWVNLLLIVIVGGLSAWITRVVGRPANGTLLMLAFAGVYVGASVLLYMRLRIWAPMMLPMVFAGFVTHLSAMTYRVRVEQSEKKRVKQLFSRLVSPDVVNEVLKEETILVGGQRREITIYFADVRGFTELTDVTQEQAAQYVRQNKLSEAEAEAHYDAQAKETLDTVSTYLGSIADIVKSHKGTLDKYIGDCVMAFWGAPLPDAHHALHAVQAAIAAQRAMAEMNLERQAKNKRRETENLERARKGLPLLAPLAVLSMGTGINTGVAIVGFMGSETHVLNYTAFGREVNLASRLEGVSGHGRIIIGEATFAALQRDDPKLAALCLEWAPRTVKGFRTAVRIYEVLWHPAAGVPSPPGEDTSIPVSKNIPA